MIEEFGKMLGHVMGLKAMNQNQMALDELRDGYKTYFELDAAFLHSIHPDEFLETILGKVDLKKQHQEALAQALMTEGELLHDSNPVSARDLREKALILYQHLEQTDIANFSMARKDAISELTAILEK
jgi:hypothetical protein